MKLWLLRPMEDNNLWDPWYDKCFGFVVRAESEEEARKIVGSSIEFGDEGKEAWLDPKNSTCVELTIEGKEEVIIRDFARA